LPTYKREYKCHVGDTVLASMRSRPRSGFAIPWPQIQSLIFGA